MKNSFFLFNLSSLSKTKIIISALGVIIFIQTVILFSLSTHTVLKILGIIEIAILFLGLSYVRRTQKFLAYVTSICQKNRNGDFEARIINLTEVAELKVLTDSINGFIDSSDAFVRESMLAIRAISRNQFYRKIIRTGMLGFFEKSAEGINGLLTRSEKEKFKIDQTIKDLNKLVVAATQGDLSIRIDSKDLDGVYKELADGMNGLMDTILKPITSLIETLSLLASGNLMENMQGDYQGSFAQIQETLNSTIKHLNEMVLKIKETAYSVNLATSEVSNGSENLSERTEQQASTLEETAASLEQITDAVRKNTENASVVNELSKDAKRIADEGRRVVDEAVDAMKKIEESSSKVENIIDIIGEIAFQTNLLALNAAVEAARAGDAGKGFSVVASEVRNLAVKSDNAAKDIKNLITVSREQVKSGTKLVNHTGEKLGIIDSSVGQVTSMIADIARATTSQSAGISEINQAMSQMEDNTQQNAALVEESSSAISSMVEQVRQLQEMIEFFKVE